MSFNKVCLFGVIASAALLVSCGNSSDNNEDEPSPDINRVSNLSCVAPPPLAVRQDGYRFVEAFPNLPGIENIIALKQAPQNNQRWFAVERGGRVVTF